VKWVWHVAVPLWSGLFIWGGVWASRSGLANMRHARDTPTSKIRSAAQGYAELDGILKQMENQPLLESALTRMPCLWWSYRIERYKSSNHKSQAGGSWELIESDSSENSAYWLCLEDDTGQCAINPKGAIITGHTTKTWQGHTRDPRKPDQRNALSKFFSSSFRYSESVLLPEHPLYALGDFKSHHGKHLMEKPGDGRPFILSGKGETKVIAAGRNDAIIGALFTLIGALGGALGLWFLW